MTEIETPLKLTKNGAELPEDEEKLVAEMGIFIDGHNI